jgi:hypothetical protein
MYIHLYINAMLLRFCSKMYMVKEVLRITLTITKLLYFSLFLLIYIIVGWIFYNLVCLLKTRGFSALVSSTHIYSIYSPFVITVDFLSYV